MNTPGYVISLHPDSQCAVCIILDGKDAFVLQPGQSMRAKEAKR
jgi:hypothetical protein